MSSVIKDNNELNGEIIISDDVIATIASVATKEVQGVCGLSLSFTGELASKFVKKTTAGKAIKVIKNDNEVTIDINVIVNYGIRIPDVSWEVQENVKKSVESMTGLNVEKVNIIVTGVDFTSAEEEKNDTSSDEN